MDEPLGGRVERQVLAEAMQAELLEPPDERKKTTIRRHPRSRQAVLIAARIVVVKSGPGQEDRRVPLPRPRPRSGRGARLHEFREDPLPRVAGLAPGRAIRCIECAGAFQMADARERRPAAVRRAKTEASHGHAARAVPRGCHRPRAASSSG